MCIYWAIWLFAGASTGSFVERDPTKDASVARFGGHLPAKRTRSNWDGRTMPSLRAQCVQPQPLKVVRTLVTAESSSLCRRPCPRALPCPCLVGLRRWRSKTLVWIRLRTNCSTWVPWNPPGGQLLEDDGRRDGALRRSTWPCLLATCGGTGFTAAAIQGATVREEQKLLPKDVSPLRACRAVYFPCLLAQYGSWRGQTCAQLNAAFVRDWAAWLNERRYLFRKGPFSARGLG